MKSSVTIQTKKDTIVQANKESLIHTYRILFKN